MVSWSVGRSNRSIARIDRSSIRPIDWAVDYFIVRSLLSEFVRSFVRFVRSFVRSVVRSFVSFVHLFIHCNVDLLVSKYTRLAWCRWLSINQQCSFPARKRLMIGASGDSLSVDTRRHCVSSTGTDPLQRHCVSSTGIELSQRQFVTSTGLQPFQRHFVTSTGLKPSQRHFVTLG